MQTKVKTRGFFRGMGRRNLVLSLLVCVFSGTASAVQHVRSQALEEAHGYTERRLDFEAEWAKASEPDRDRLRAEVLRYRNVGLPALRRLDSERIVRWTHLLAGRAIPSLPEEMERWFARVELRLVPGWHTVESLKADPQLIVRVKAPSRPPGFTDSKMTAQFVLHWVDGKGKRSRARDTSVHAADFGGAGFELYLQLPEAGVGDWRLEPSLVFDGKTHWGHAAHFSVLGELPSWASGSGSGSPWEVALSEQALTGFRDSRWGGASAFFAGGHGLESRFELERGPQGQSLTLRMSTEPLGSSRALVWVVLPSNRLLEGEFLGARGAGWRRLAARGVTIVASHAPLASAPGGGSTVASRLPLATAALGDIPKILVVGGGSARGLGMGSSQVFEGFDALVLFGPRRNDVAPRAPFPSAPTLFLLPTDPWSAPALPATQRSVVSMDPAVVMGMDLPRHILENLDWLCSSRKEEPGASEGE